jgi:hypothetical protein
VIPELKAVLDKGYTFHKEGACRGCAARILWFITPKQKHIPLDPVTYEPHWATCPRAADFKRKQ